MIGDRTEAAVGFLRHALARGALDTSELEAQARAAGLLGQCQQIRHAKTFKRAKKSLGIRSVRDGFGSGGKWAWLLPTQKTESTSPPDASEEVRPDVAVGILERIPTELQGRRIPLHWLKGLAHLDHHRPPTDIPRHRWRQFLTDCVRFVSSSENWAERAAELGWNDLTLFGCRCTRPLDHLASAGLLWAINGGTLVELRRDWAVIERAEDRSRRVHHRRPLNATNVTLPWSGRHGLRQGE
jgi:hypothetical protein